MRQGYSPDHPIDEPTNPPLHPPVNSDVAPPPHQNLTTPPCPSPRLDITEFLSGLKKKGLKGLTDSQLTALHGDCDTNQDGQITIAEFVSIPKLYHAFVFNIKIVLTQQ